MRQQTLWNWESNLCIKRTACCTKLRTAVNDTLNLSDTSDNYLDLSDDRIRGLLCRQNYDLVPRKVTFPISKHKSVFSLSSSKKHLSAFVAWNPSFLSRAQVSEFHTAHCRLGLLDPPTRDVVQYLFFYRLHFLRLIHGRERLYTFHQRLNSYIKAIFTIL